MAKTPPLAAALAKRPLFTSEGPQYASQAFAHNSPFARPGPYQTPLHPSQEGPFLAWLKQSQVPFNPNDPRADYDMRGYWMNTGGQGWTPGQHFPDTYKTPYDTSFSNQSMYATANNPFKWVGDRLIDTRTGQVVYR